MSFVQAILYGAVSGFCRLSPISWSGHQSLIQYFWGDFQVTPSCLTMIDIGLLIAIIVFFHKDLWNMIRHIPRRYNLIVLIASLPGIVMGIFLRNSFSDPMPWLASILLVLTAGILWITERNRGKKQVRDLSPIIALLIGLSGMLSLIPGLSFVTIVLFVSVKQGLSRQTAFHFVYLIMIPMLISMILGNFYDAMLLAGTFSITFQELFVAAIAMVTGFFGIYCTNKMLARRKYHRFAIYCMLAAVLSFCALLLGM